MHSKNHRQNHDFQIQYFLAGKCHTPDGAYALLCDLKEDREAAIANHRVCSLREEAKEVRAHAKLQSKERADELEAKADLLEIAYARETGDVLLAAAKDELAFIGMLMKAIEPLRRFKDLNAAEAHEACQLLEWEGELIARAENHLILTGTIPPEEFATMRAHPNFATRILPTINTARAIVGEPDGFLQLIAERKEGSVLKAITDASKTTNGDAP
jgi:hypothetical protein